jgi:hypothetical protein
MITICNRVVDERIDRDDMVIPPCLPLTIALLVLSFDFDDEADLLGQVCLW